MMVCKLWDEDPWGWHWTLKPFKFVACPVWAYHPPGGWPANNRKKGGSCAYHFTGCVFWASCPSRNHQNILASQSWLPMWLPSLPLPLSPRQLLSWWLSAVSWVLIAQKRNLRRISNPLPFPLAFQAWAVISWTQLVYLDCLHLAATFCSLRVVRLLRMAPLPTPTPCVASGSLNPCEAKKALNNLTFFQKLFFEDISYSSRILSVIAINQSCDPPKAQVHHPQNCAPRTLSVTIHRRSSPCKP